ncbi:DUF3108 domain-containing protein [uncultured Campylobacter sp.]|uniref:DUF3108 domain-containing protein n=1 Tax=uncultured Campylobacter sp. TaxID=218934 RepID=UPI002638AAA5|nr:DUF3108 domain-containing protein [uncultured Campylobacter sp.]
MRLFFVIVFIAISTFAKGAEEVHFKYDVSFGIFGKIGSADAVLKSENNSYEITLDAKSSGLAKTLSGNRREYFYSKGEIKDGTLIPEVYIHNIERNSGKVVVEKYYTFDHKGKSVYMLRFITKNGLRRKDIDKKIDYYATNDLLTLFFNFPKLKQDGSSSFVLTAVGANKSDGRVDIIVPSKKESKKLKKELKTHNQPYIVYINEKIFSSKRGKLFVGLDDQGYATKAVLKDVLFFGDITGEVKEKIKNSYKFKPPLSN